MGSAALLPGIGTLAALSAAAGETAVFLEATAFFALATAAVYGVPAENRERRRALVLAVLVGDDSKHAIGELLGPGRTNGAWLSEGVASLPMPALSQLNSRLLKCAVRRYTLRRSALLFGKMLPVGIGAIIGAIGNRLVGKKIVRNTRKAFGTPPARWPVTLAPAAHGSRRRLAATGPGDAARPGRSGRVADCRQRVSLYGAETVGAAAGEMRRHRVQEVASVTSALAGQRNRGEQLP